MDGYRCKLKCERCGEIEFAVPYRAETDDLGAWLETVIRPAMGKAHVAHNALCTMKEADLFLPIEAGAKGIGVRVKQ